MGKAREIYKEQVLQIGHLYFVKRKKLWQIAEQLKIDPQTVWRNVEKYREWTLEVVDPNKIVKEHLIESLSIKRNLIDNCYKDLEEGFLEPKDKIALRRLIEDLEKDTLDLFERLQLIQKPTEEIQITVNKYEEDKKWAADYYLKRYSNSTPSSSDS